MSSISICTHVQSIIYPMNAGDGPLSYAQNSSYQRGALDVAKPIIEEEIAKELDMIKDVTLVQPYVCIADFGCSTGHNSFPAMQIIIDAINKKHQQYCSNKLINLEFCVYFNDVVSNDFGTLFSSLPVERGYHAAGVPGDFHRRLLPQSSIHVAYSSWSLHWLTRAPEVVNQGRILYSEEREEVCDAYLEQFGKDLEAFLECRAVEIVVGGLMVLLIPGAPASFNHQTEYTEALNIHFLGSCLLDMAKKGRLSMEKIDSFNLPYYFTTPQQLKGILHKSQTFSIERMEVVDNPGKYTLRTVEARAAYYRAIHEGLFTHYFGSDIIDELFDLYAKKLAASPLFLNPNNNKSFVILLILKRLR